MARKKHNRSTLDGRHFQHYKNKKKQLITLAIKKNKLGVLNKLLEEKNKTL